MLSWSFGRQIVTRTLSRQFERWTVSRKVRVGQTVDTLQADHSDDKFKLVTGTATGKLSRQLERWLFGSL